MDDTLDIDYFQRLLDGATTVREEAMGWVEEWMGTSYVASMRSTLMFEKAQLGLLVSRAVPYKSVRIVPNTRGAQTGLFKYM
jgi:hypothetical protein